MEPTQADDPQALSETVRASTAYRISSRIEALRINFYVFDRNYQELKRLKAGVNKTETLLVLWDMKNRDQLDIVINEAARILQNFLASARALVAQTKVMISSWYHGTEFLAQYEAEVQSHFRGDPLTGFIEDLRNYNLHYALPLANAKISVHMGEDRTTSAMEFSFVLEKEGLLIWSGWSPKSRPFLDRAEEEIDINTLSDGYYQKIQGFHSWILERLQQLHADELAWLSEMRRRVINAMPHEEREIRGLTEE